MAEGVQQATHGQRRQRLDPGKRRGLLLGGTRRQLYRRLPAGRRQARRTIELERPVVCHVHVRVRGRGRPDFEDRGAELDSGVR